MRIGYVYVAALAAAACVGDKAELGGMDNRVAIPAVTKACNLDELKLVQPGTFVFPADALLFYYAQQKSMSLKTMTLRFDVNEQGTPVNISYVGPQADMKHATKQKLIRASVEGLKGRRYEWIGTPAFATGCTTGTDVLINVSRQPA